MLAFYLLALGTAASAFIACVIIAAVVVVFVALLVRVASRKKHPLLISLVPWPESGRDGEAEPGWEVRLINQGVSLAQVRVELHVRRPFGESALSGMRGSQMRRGGEGTGGLANGQEARFRATRSEVLEGAIVITPDVRAEMGLRELRDADFAVLVYDGGHHLLRAEILRPK